jgi:hypothetical protein
MDFLSSLTATSKKRKLPFLVIGGQAIAAWNVPRETADFDILVNRDQKPAWMDCVAEMKYHLFHDGGNFLQFTSTAFPSWPLDLMLVSPETFAKMAQAAVSKRLLGHELRLPSLPHLIALKLHALKQDLPHRRVRDFLDVVELLQNNGSHPADPDIKPVFEQFGTPAIYEKVVNACS